MDNILLIDFGSTYTKVTAVNLSREEVLGTAKSVTTITTDITTGLETAMNSLFSQTGKLEFSETFGCSSAAGGLKMVAVGLVPELTAEAAKRAALGAGAKVMKVFAHKLSQYEIQEIEELKPDIILLAGGTDGGNEKVILHNADMLATLSFDVPVVVAGNKSATPEVVKALAKMSDTVAVANVMPTLDEINIEPARTAIRNIFLKRIINAKGLNRAQKIVGQVLMPTPAAVLEAARVLSQGTAEEAGIGDLMVVDIGGATTDVYSVAKGEPTLSQVTLRGLPEPFDKRTVEGDLGMRYSATVLLKAAGTRLIAEYAGVTEAEAEAYSNKVEKNIDYLPQDDCEIKIELAMGRACVKLGADRHVGNITSYFSPQGRVFVQEGKDLTNLQTVIGTGGVIVNSLNPQEILKGIRFEEDNACILKPKNPKYFIDKEYIMASMGLLAQTYPAAAIRLMKKYII